ncbi:immunity 49 family protein [Pyxidicoccus parkwayensis]|uniref:Immunity 49 family protein n=1 Tax=Pyxidicoccus parkwayensis TaxID=2813578 RepID=A0ABX7NXT1_9BACT|nr:Imm49 family immunity protein [Pyxidicoccus parkwaysis]QSQ23712.1 immunity 49 family protein [Pyxidicoccus parkwaysis]
MNKLDMRAVAASATASAALLEHALEQGGHPPEKTERILFHLSRYLRAAGIARLLTEVDRDAFRLCLQHSAEARRQLLQWAIGARRPFNRFTATGHHGPLCDALAVGADELARDIVRLSSDTPVKAYEHEEDFLYARLLGLLALDADAAPGRAEPLLDALEHVLEGQEAPRLAMGRALVARKQDAFDAALDDLLTEHASRHDAMARIMSAEDECSLTERYVSVEGLALLRLAQRRGLAVQTEYIFLPSLARAPW